MANVEELEARIALLEEKLGDLARFVAQIYDDDVHLEWGLDAGDPDAGYWYLADDDGNGLRPSAALGGLEHAEVVTSDA